MKKIDKQLQKIDKQRYWDVTSKITPAGQKELRRLLKQLDGPVKDLKKFIGDDGQFWVSTIIYGIEDIRDQFLKREKANVPFREVK